MNADPVTEEEILDATEKLTIANAVIEEKKKSLKLPTTGQTGGSGWATG